MRQLGIGILGLFSGLLVSLVVIEVVSRTAIAGGSDIAGNLGLSAFLGLVSPVLAIIGILVALWIDRRMQAGRK